MTISELKALLGQQEKGVLVDFLIEEVKGNALLLHHVLTEFTDDWLDEACFGDRQQWLHEVLKNTEIDWDGDCVPSESAQEALALFYRQVDRAITIGRFKEAVALLLIADEEVSALDQYGVWVDALLDDVTKRFAAIATAPLDEQMRSSLFWHLVDTYPDESRCRHLALALVQTEEEQAALWELVEDDSFDQDIAFELVLKRAGRAEQEAFLFGRETGYRVWNRAIEEAIESGDWERVIRYCLRAQERFSFFDGWKSFLLQAYLELDMVEEARALTFSMVVYRGMDYTKLKELTPPEEWNETVNQLYELMKESDRGCASMLEDEGRLDLLIEEVERDPRLLIPYWELLKDPYRDRIITLTKKQCTRAVTMDSPREDFVRLVNLLGILKSLGKEREADKRIVQLLERYPTKRMLKEELRRSGLME